MSGSQPDSTTRLSVELSGEVKMKKHVIAVALMAAAAVAAQADTLSKVKSAGAITMGVRDSSGALSYTLGDGK
jgi:glutamate/aspartate transport system substrate-binding protein